MVNVKRTFFLTKEEAEEQKNITGNKYIDYQSPHYELESGDIMWGMAGSPAGMERWHGYKK
jgi:hypothetical protein